MPPLRSGFCFGDFLVILIALFIVFILFTGFGGDGRYRLELRTPDGKWRYDLPTERRITLSGSAGTFVVVINGNEVAIEETHCPDKSCARMGPMSGEGRTGAGRAMICVPQRIELTLIADGHEPEVDTVCY